MLFVLQRGTTQVTEKIQSQVLCSASGASLEGTALSTAGATFWVVVRRQPGEGITPRSKSIYRCSLYV